MQRLSGAAVTSAPQTAWSKPSGRNGDSASSLAWPPGPWPQSWPRAIASVSATLSRQAREIAAATCATSRAWVSRVRWWSAGKMNTWVLPAKRRKAAECMIRSRSRSKQVRQGSGASSIARLPAPTDRVAPGASVQLLLGLSRLAVEDARRPIDEDEPANEGPAKYGPTDETGGLCAVRMAGSPLGWPLMVDAHRRDCSLITDKDAACTTLDATGKV